MRHQSTARVLHRASKAKGVHKDVHITSDDGQVDVYDVTISRKLAEEVTWLAHGKAGATIEFPSPAESPFAEHIFHVPASGSLSSGPATASAVEGKYYKYTVKGRTGKNDPGVIIHN